MMNSLASILNSKSNNSPLVRGVTAAMVVEATNKVLEQFFGPTIKEHANAAYLKNDVLCIACLSSVAAQEIKLRENELLGLLQTQFPAVTIKKIRYLS